jgi:hypothetical protein
MDSASCPELPGPEELTMVWRDASKPHVHLDSSSRKCSLRTCLPLPASCRGGRGKQSGSYVGVSLCSLSDSFSWCVPLRLDLNWH